jgi:hypothetical protein
MMCWVSMKCDDALLGIVVLNRETMQQACEAAADIAERETCGEHRIQCVALELPAGNAPIPAHAIGKLLSYEQAEEAFGPLSDITATMIDDTLARQKKRRSGG